MRYIIFEDLVNSFNEIVQNSPFYIWLQKSTKKLRNSYSKQAFKKWLELKGEVFYNIDGEYTKEDLKALFATDTYYSFLLKLLVFSILTKEEKNSNFSVEKIESDVFYNQYNIDNFILKNFYDWYLYEDPKVEEIDQFANKFFLFTKDERLFNNDIPKRIHKLLYHKENKYYAGEYYSPEWLAEYIIDLSGFEGNKKERIIDLCCGSGSLLIFALKKILKTNKGNNLEPNQILNNIYGFDINPLAVLSTKVNLIISLRDFIPFKKLITLNIYEKDVVELTGEFNDNQYDYVISNPPWLNWKSISERYKRKIKPIIKRYGLFNHKGLKAKLGFASDDISGIITCISIDKLLKDNGKLIFVLPQSLFRSYGGGEGFRGMFSNQEIKIKIQRIVDLSNILPFKYGSIRAVILFVVKGFGNKFPVNYDIIEKRGNTLSSFKGLNDFYNKTKVKNYYAEPIDQNNTSSPLIILKHYDIEKILRKIISKSYYKARAGVCTWLNGVYWINILQRDLHYCRVVNNSECGKTKVNTLTRNIDTELIYPLIRGKDIKRWYSDYSGYIIFPQDPENPSKAIKEEIMSRKYKLTYEYFLEFKDLLLSRKGYKSLISREPFYAIYDAGIYTMAQYKVGWKYLSKELNASIIYDAFEKVIIPDLNAITISADSLEEAYYLCALLNSSIVKIIIKTYGNSLRISPGIMEYLPIPKFNIEKNKNLSLIGDDCNANYNNKDRIKSNEDEIDSIFANILEIGNGDLKIIKDYINEN